MQRPSAGKEGLEQDAALKERVMNLERSLQEKDQEVARLSLIVSSSSNNKLPPGALFGFRLCRDRSSSFEPFYPICPSSADASGGPPGISESELKQAYCQSVQSLKDYMASSRLLTFDITGKGRE